MLKPFKWAFRSNVCPVYDQLLSLWSWNASSADVTLFLQEMSLGVGESIPVLIQFDPSYKDDFVTRTAESQLEVSFKEHPQKVNNISLYCEKLGSLLRRAWPYSLFFFFTFKQVLLCVSIAWKP